MSQIASIDTSLVLLLSDLRQVIESAKRNVAVTANYELTMIYWHIGERINRDVLNNQRAEYGKQIVAEVARQLQTEYGSKAIMRATTRTNPPRLGTIKRTAIARR